MIVARAAIISSADGHAHIAGKLERFHDDLERHSYDAEVIAFIDVAHHLPQHARAIVITDCLSGASAAVAFHKLSARKAAAKHLARELDSLHSHEALLESIYYLWCHSHQGATPNEAADILAGDAISQEGAPYKEPPLTVAPTFAIGYVPGIKRSIGRTALEVFNLQQLQVFYGASHHTLYPSAATWKFFARPRDKGSRLLTEQACDICEDEQQDRLGLPWERTYISNAAHGRRSLPSFLRGITACLVCGRPTERSSRWHMKFGCPGKHGELKAKREGIALWIAANAQRLNARQASAMLQAISCQGSHFSTMHTGSPDEARCAMDGACGLPWTPDDAGSAKSRNFAKLFAQHVVVPWTEITTAFIASIGTALAPPPPSRGPTPLSAPPPLLSGFFYNDLWIPAPLSDLIRQWKARRAARAWLHALRDMIIERGPGRNCKLPSHDATAQGEEVRRLSYMLTAGSRQSCLHRKRQRCHAGSSTEYVMAGPDDAETVRRAIRDDRDAETAQAVSVTWAGTRWFALLVLRAWKMVTSNTLTRTSPSQQTVQDAFRHTLRTCVYMRSRGFKVLNLGELACIARDQKRRERDFRAAQRKAPSWGFDLSDQPELTFPTQALPADADDTLITAAARVTFLTVIPPRTRRNPRRRDAKGVAITPITRRRKPTAHPAAGSHAPRRSRAHDRYLAWARSTAGLRRRLSTIRASIRANRAQCSFTLARHLRRKRARMNENIGDGDAVMPYPLATLPPGAKRQKFSFNSDPGAALAAARGRNELAYLGVYSCSLRAAALYALSHSHVNWILSRSPSNCEEGHCAPYILCTN